MSVPTKCEVCEAAVPAEEDFCPHCGAQMKGEPPPKPHFQVGQTILQTFEVVQVGDCDGQIERYVVREREVRQEPRLFWLAVEWRSEPEEAPAEAGEALQAARGTGNGARSGLQREAETLRRAAMAGVVPAANFGVTPQANFLQVQCPTGPTLAELVQGMPRLLTGHELLHLMIPVCEAVAALHEQEVFHLNLTLETIYVENGRVALTDFRRAQIRGEEVFNPLVTEGYAAPELYGMVAGGPDERTDVFALGAVLYYLLRGTGPQSSLAEQMFLFEEPEGLTGLRADLLGLVLQATAAVPEKRLASAAAFREALADLARRRRAATDLSVSASALCDLGLGRENNEDSVVVMERDLSDEQGRQYVGLFAVADGMGGHEAGEVASTIAVETLAEQVATELFRSDLHRPTLVTAPEEEVQTFLRRTVRTINRRIAEATAEVPAAARPGTTLSACLLIGETAFLIHIGDSRIYLLRQGQLHRLTVDDSVVQRLVERGQITPEEAFEHPLSHQLVAALDGQPDREPWCAVTSVAPGDRLLLCSDGLSGVLRDEQLENLLEEGGETRAIAQRLVTEVKHLQSQDHHRLAQADNISVIVVKIEL